MSNVTEENASGGQSHSSWRLWLGIILALTALGFGCFGYWKYEGHPAPDIWSVFYHSIQLLELDAPFLERSIPWQLHVGRYIGAFFLFYAVLLGVMKIFHNEMLLLKLRLPWRRGHVVICGLGDLGLRLALDGCPRYFIVAIEKHCKPAALEAAREKGIFVLEGDACDPALLRTARIDRAKFVIATCDEDSTNVAITSLAGQIAAQRPAALEPLTSRLLVQNISLRELLRRENVFPPSCPSFSVNFDDLHHWDTAARQALRIHPLDFEPIRKNDEATVCLVVVGFGQMGWSMALQAARTGHHAYTVEKKKQLSLVIVAPDPERCRSELRNHQPNLEKFCDVSFENICPDNCWKDNHTVIAKLTALFPPGDALVTYAFCRDDDETTNFCQGVVLAKTVGGRRAQVLIYQRTRKGFAALFSKEVRGTGLGARVHAFGMREDILTWDTIIRESEDILARALHEKYRAHRAREGVDEPAWEELSDTLKDSNRQAAEHIEVKLRALGYHSATEDAGREAITRFTENDFLLLCKMEHSRWCAERWLAGWEYGQQTNRLRKINKCLVPWDDLLPADQQKDREQIEAIPEILSRIGKAIYR